jgi:heme A synthase
LSLVPRYAAARWLHRLAAGLIGVIIPDPSRRARQPGCPMRVACGAITIILPIAAHVGGVIYHTFICRDGPPSRMI